MSVSNVSGNLVHTYHNTAGRRRTEDTNGVSNFRNSVFYAKLNNAQANYMKTSKAAEITTEKNNSEVIGLTMLPADAYGMSYGMRAQYAANSTKENPIIQVTSNYGGETVSYNVNINEVNPKNASQLEMFALCSYADDQRMSEAGTFGSYQKMKYYADNAQYNGYFNGLGSYESILGGKYNWTSMVSRMMTDYLNAGIYNQYHDGLGLLGLFNKFPLF